MGRDKEKRKVKGEKFKRFELNEEQAAVLLSMLRQAQHPDPQTEVAFELIETLEAAGTPLKGEEEKRIKAYEFPEEVEVVVSVAACEYLNGSFFRELRPQGFILKTYTQLKKAVKNSESVTDKELIDDGWERREDVWFGPKSGSNAERTEEASEKEVEEDEVPSEEPAEEPAGAAV